MHYYNIYYEYFYDALYMKVLLRFVLKNVVANKWLCILHSKKCWVVSTQIWVKYGQTQKLG